MTGCFGQEGREHSFPVCSDCGAELDDARAELAALREMTTVQAYLRLSELNDQLRRELDGDDGNPGLRSNVERWRSRAQAADADMAALREEMKNNEHTHGAQVRRLIGSLNEARQELDQTKASLAAAEDRVRAVEDVSGETMCELLTERSHRCGAERDLAQARTDARGQMGAILSVIRGAKYGPESLPALLKIEDIARAFLDGRRGDAGMCACGHWPHVHGIRGSGTCGDGPCPCPKNARDEAPRRQCPHCDTWVVHADWCPARDEAPRTMGYYVHAGQEPAPEPACGRWPCVGEPYCDPSAHARDEARGAPECKCGVFGGPLGKFHAMPHDSGCPRATPPGADVCTCRPLKGERASSTHGPTCPVRDEAPGWTSTVTKPEPGVTLVQSWPPDTRDEARGAPECSRYCLMMEDGVVCHTLTCPNMTTPSASDALDYKVTMRATPPDADGGEES